MNLYGAIFPYVYQDVFKQLNQIDVWRKILGNPTVETGDIITNPLRPDHDAGCYLRDYNGAIFMTDFAYPEYNRYTCVHAVAKIHNLSLNQASTLIMSVFKHGLKVDLGSGLKTYSTGLKKAQMPKVKDFYFEPFTFEGKAGYTERDRQYWSVRGVSSRQLRKYNIFSVKKWFYNNNVTYPDYPCYAYYFLQDGATKIYCPTERKHRFPFSSTSKNHIWKTSQSTTSEFCIITKSLKDLMVLENVFPEVDIHAFQNEGVIPDELEYYKTYSKVFILFDNDNAGRVASARLAKELRKYVETHVIEIPEHTFCKDADDVRVRLGEEQLCSIMSDLVWSSDRMGYHPLEVKQKSMLNLEDLL